MLVALRFRELGLVSRDRECNLQLPSARPVIGYATTCECTPEPRSGVGADGSGRLSAERGRIHIFLSFAKINLKFAKIR